MQRSLLVISLTINLVFILLFINKRFNRTTFQNEQITKPISDSVVLKKRVNQFVPAFIEHRRGMLNYFPIKKTDIVMLGNSLTNQGEWTELFQNLNIKNRGITGDNTDGALNRLPKILEGKPQKIFILIGINDLSDNKSPEYIIANYRKIITFIKQNSPKTTIYIQSLFPINKDILYTETIEPDEILVVNTDLRKLADEFKITYIDLHCLLADDSGKLRTDLTLDGLHLNIKGYLIWKDKINPYIL